MGERIAIVLVVFLVLCYANEIRSYESDHRYSWNDTVPFYANKIGPYSNPSETYAYYDYPFCHSGDVQEKKHTLGEALNGDRLVSSPYKLDFLVNQRYEIACSKKLSKEDVSQFRFAIDQDYYMEMYYDDLPIHILIGEAERNNTGNPKDNRYLLYTHIWFDVFFNKDRVIEINAFPDRILMVDLVEDKEVDVEFLYDVLWWETKIPFNKRMDIYRMQARLPKRVETHRMLIFDSCIVILDSCIPVLILVIGLLQLYRRKLKKDFDKYLHDTESGENEEITGWKSLHGDVFRHPMHKSLFAAVVGSGTQLIVLTLLITMLGVLGIFHPYNRGFLITTVVVAYAFTSGIAGYSAVSIYSQLEGTNFVKTLLLTASIFLGPLFVTFCILNTVAMTYKVTAALPLRVILALFSMYIFVGLPLLLLGGIIRKHTGSGSQAPCRTFKCPRAVPRQRWYRRLFPRMAMGGLILFYVIYIEFDYALATLWSLGIYTTYPFLLIFYTILLVLTSLLAICDTYNRLAIEDHRWWWRSLLSGGSCAFIMFGYCVYYFNRRVDMHGVLQTMFFFGYMASICYAFFLMLGAVGFYSSLLFVRHIYGAIKCE